MTTPARARDPAELRSSYAAFRTITTRWVDTDLYQHVNNVVFYSWVDTAVNGWLVERGLLEIGSSPLVGLIVESGCRFLKPVHFPSVVQAGIRVARIGGSSVRYEVGVFADDDATASASAFFVHVYVDAQTRRPAPLPDRWRDTLGALAVRAGQERPCPIG